MQERSKALRVREPRSVATIRAEDGEVAVVRGVVVAQREYDEGVEIEVMREAQAAAIAGFELFACPHEWCQRTLAVPRHRFGGEQVRPLDELSEQLIDEAPSAEDPALEFVQQRLLRGHWYAEGVEALLETDRSEEHTSELQSQSNLVCRLLLEKKKKINR